MTSVERGLGPTLVHRGHTYEITSSRGVERDGEVQTRAALLALDLHGRVWRWLRANGMRRPSPSGPSGAGGKTSRVLGGWRVDPKTKARVAKASRADDVSESAWVERAIVARLDADPGPSSLSGSAFVDAVHDAIPNAFEDIDDVLRR